MKKKTKYIEVTTLYDGNTLLSKPKTLKDWEKEGIDKKAKYLIYEPEKLTEVDITLIVSNKS